MKENKGTKKIIINLKSQEEKDNKGMALKAVLIYLLKSIKTISLKGDNWKSIIFAYNPVYYTWMKHINIQYYYIYDKITTR